KTNVTRYDFQQVWNINTNLLTPAELDYFIEFWAGGFGSGYGFRIRIISDFYMVDEVVGVGDGIKTTFPIIPSALGAALGVPAFTVKLNTTPTTAYTINNTTGVITTNSPPANGVSVKV